MCKMQLNKRNWHVITNIGIFFAILFGAFFLISSNVYAAMDETEPNDNMTQANTVKVGETVYGTTGQSPKNNDYYKIIPPVSGDIKIDAYADDPSGKDSIYVAIISSDGDGIMYDWDFSDNPSGTSLVFSVISGNTYYVYVADSGGEDLIDYHLVTGYSIGKTSIKSVKGKKGIYCKMGQKSEGIFL